MTKATGWMRERRRSIVSHFFLLLILLLSTFIQFTAVSRTTIISPLRADARDYFSYAYNLKNFGVYSRSPTWAEAAPATVPEPDAVRAPGYPLLISLIGNPEPTEAFLRKVSYVQAALGVLSVLLMFLVSARFLKPGWSHSAALLTALSPHLAVISTYLLTESLFFFLLMGSIYSSIRALESQRRWPYALAGFLWGLCSLVRPTVQFLPVLMLLAVLAIPRLRRYRLAGALGFVCFVATLTPWLIRNQTLPTKPQASLMVNFLHHGSYPNFMYEGRRETYGFPYRFDPNSERIARDIPVILNHIIERFRNEPLEYARWYLIGKPGFLLSWADVQSVGDIYIYDLSHTPYLEDLRFAYVRALMYALHWPLMMLGLVGGLILILHPEWLGLEPPARRAAGILAWIVLYAIGFHMIGAPFPRYGIPFRPLLFALALVLIQGLWLRWRGAPVHLHTSPL